MAIIDTIERILKTQLTSYNLQYCLVNQEKLPFKLDGSFAKPNKKEDFVSLDCLIENFYSDNNFNKLKDFAGVGVSIQASNICAIDVDHCFSKAFDISSVDERGRDIIKRFQFLAYIEFSFSGTGLRLLFKGDLIDNYSSKYYIKNQANGIEYYQPSDSYRYVTITGKVIFNNPIEKKEDLDLTLSKFLNDYMIKPELKITKKRIEKKEERSLEELLKIVKIHYFKNPIFQDLWFDKAPGSGSNESERDFHLIAYLYENVTCDKDLIKQIFEFSPFFKSKDYRHRRKWNYNNFRYFNYLYNVISN